MRRGEIYDARLEPTEGSEQGGTRPIIIVSRDAIVTYVLSFWLFPALLCVSIGLLIASFNKLNFIDEKKGNWF